MENNVIKRLQTYITAELGDAALYKELAKYAPTENDSRLLLEFSADEQAHADEFQRIYRSMTGRNYNPTIAPVEFSGSYRSILLDRVIDESGDFRKYGEQYIQTNNNMQLRNAYFRAQTDENVHALRILYLLDQ